LRRIALAVQLDAVNLLGQVIEDPVGDGGFAQRGVSYGDGELAGDDGRAALDTVLDDLGHLGGLIGAERTDQEVVDDQDDDAVVGVNPVGFGECHDLCRFEATGPPDVDVLDGGPGTAAGPLSTPAGGAGWRVR
jgi:hypothetical protein